VNVIDDPMSEDKPTATRLIQAMSEKYAQCSSYSDSGRERRSDEWDVRFCTYFVRPDKMRFEWIRGFGSCEEHGMFRSDGRTTFSRDIFADRVIEEKSLVAAVAGATGISSGTAFIIPSLLISIPGKRTLAQLRDLRIVDQEAVDDLLCYHLLAGLDSPNDTDLWLAANDFSVRKMRSKSVIRPEALAKAVEIIEKTMADPSKLPPEYQEAVKQFDASDVVRKLLAVNRGPIREFFSEIVYADVKFDKVIQMRTSSN
jgi:hypothetical protein